MIRFSSSMRLAVVTAVAAVALASTALPVAARDQEQVTLRLGMFANVTHASALVAYESGLLEKELGQGIRLEVSYFNAGPAAVQALFAGALDATFIGPNPAINGFQQSNGEALRIISGATSGGAFLVVKPAITKVADLEGKKIATPQLGNTQDVAIRAYLKSKGMKTDTTGGGDVSILPQANATSLQAFKDGLIDGAWVPEPWASRLVNEAGGRVLVDEADLWPNGQFVTTHLIAATDFIKNHPDVVKRLVTGQVAATDFLAKNRVVAEKLVNEGILNATGQRVDPLTITNAWENLTFTVDPIASSLAKSAKDAEEVGLLQPVNLKGIYDLKILNKVLASQGKPPVSSSLKAAKTTSAS